MHGCDGRLETNESRQNKWKKINGHDKTDFFTIIFHRKKNKNTSF